MAKGQKAKSKTQIPPILPAPSPAASISAAPQRHSIGKVIGAAFRKQWLFLIGTLIIIGTWYVDNFTVDDDKEKISRIRDDREEYYRFANSISQNQFEHQTFEMLSKNSLDSTKYAPIIDKITEEQANNYIATLFSIMNLEYGDDSIKVARARSFKEIDDLNRWITTHNKRQINGFVHWAGDKYERDQQVAQDTSAVRMLTIASTTQKTHLWSLLGFIIGTVFISLNKALEYLRSISDKTP